MLNSAVVDRIFRCISGSVAVSAFELAALPLPAPEIMLKLDALLERGTPEISIEKFLYDAYHTSPSEVAA